MESVLLQVMASKILKISLQELQIQIPSSRNPREMPYLLSQNLFSNHRHRVVSPSLLYRLRLDEVFLLTSSSPSSYREACIVGKCYGIFQIIACWAQICMTRQTMMTTPATSRVLRLPMTNEDRNLRKFHFFHLKQLQEFLLLAHLTVHVRVRC